MWAGASIIKQTGTTSTKEQVKKNPMKTVN